jgi:hypothetical protein
MRLVQERWFLYQSLIDTFTFWMLFSREWQRWPSSESQAPVEPEGQEFSAGQWVV